MVVPNHPHRPFPPVKAGISPLVIALIAIGGVLVVGGGSCLAIGGLVLASAADSESSTEPAANAPRTRRGPAAPATATTAAPATAPTSDPDPDPASDPASSSASDSDPAPAPAPATAPAAAAAPAAATGSWSCTASASVRVCGFANACNMQMVFGNGFGKDRFLAQQQAKSSCEAMARAKGASAVCIVQCSVR